MQFTCSGNDVVNILSVLECTVMCVCFTSFLLLLLLPIYYGRFLSEIKPN